MARKKFDESGNYLDGAVPTRPYPRRGKRIKPPATSDTELFLRLGIPDNVRTDGSYVEQASELFDQQARIPREAADRELPDRDGKGRFKSKK